MPRDGLVADSRDGREGRRPHPRIFGGTGSPRGRTGAEAQRLLGAVAPAANGPGATVGIQPSSDPGPPLKADWHPADVLAALWKRGLYLQGTVHKAWLSS